MKNKVSEFVKEMRLGGCQPVRLEARYMQFAGGWVLCRQSGVSMGEPFASHEAALAFHSKAWQKAWVGY